MGFKGSNTVEVYLTCLLLAKSPSFFGNPFVKISLLLRFIVEAFSLHQPFQLLVELLVQNDELSHCPF